MKNAAGKEGDFLKAGIACLKPGSLRATLVSNRGSHCEVWRTSMRHPSKKKSSPYLEFVIKYPRGSHSRAEISMLSRHYTLLRNDLEDIIPQALFFVTEIGGKPNVAVIAEAVDIWFNIANPHNREEAVTLLSAHPKALNQLGRFIEAAKQWRTSADPRIIDLFGVDNLVMNTNREIRYLDSFFVFFFEDMLDMFDERDDVLENCVKISLERLAYLDAIFGEATRRSATTGGKAVRVEWR